MKQAKTNKTIRITLYFLIVAGVMIAFATWRGSVLGQASQEYRQRQLKAAVEACIPNNPPGIVKNVDLGATATVDDRTYYFFYAYDGPIPENPEPSDPNQPNYEGYPSNLVISVNAQGCRMDHFNPMNDPIPLAQTLPRDVARLLTLDRYERTIEQIGRDGLQARINSWEATPLGSKLWDEEQWALEQLGMDIPPELIREAD